MRSWLAILFLVLALAAAVTAAGLWLRAGAEATELSAQCDERRTELDSTRTDLRKESLRFMGFQRGMDAIPDSIRLAQAGATMEQSNTYQKSIRMLEATERGIVLAIGKLEARITDVLDARRRDVLPPAAAAVVFLAAGLGLLAAGRRRRVAS